MSPAPRPWSPFAATPTTTSTASGRRGSRVKPITEIETARLLLHQWREEDLEAYPRRCADPEVMWHFPYVLAREKSEAQVGRFVRHWDERGFGLWAVEEKASGAIIGFVGLQYNEEWSKGEHKAEVGWRLDRAWWNRDFATEGAPASLDYGFEVRELERFISFTVPKNAASLRAMEKCGLVQQGETRWSGLDHDWYAIDRWD